MRRRLAFRSLSLFIGIFALCHCATAAVGGPALNPRAQLGSQNTSLQVTASDALSEQSSDSDSREGGGRQNQSKSLQLPFVDPTNPDFKPQDGQFASVAGDFAANMCGYLGRKLPQLLMPSFNVNWTFSQYYVEGSNPSMELLVDVYPDGVLDSKAKKRLPKILHNVGYDVDIKRDFGYGKTGTPSGSRAAQNGPLGGLPAFCRVGGFVNTTNTTRTFFEAWLPLASDPSLPLAVPNATDFPTNSTPIYLGPGGEFVQAPANLQVLDWFSHKANASNDDDDGGENALKRRSLTETASPPPPSALEGDAILGPNDGWNGRIFFVGNGAQRGFVPIPDLKQIMSRYRFAVLGSNLGHFSGSSEVDWVIGPDREEKIRDFVGGRSHATVLSVGRRLVDLYYGPSSGVRTGQNSTVRSYVAGCSVGGAGTLSTILSYPDAFDGALAGCPALDATALNYAQTQVQRSHRKREVGDGYVSNQLLVGAVRKSVLDQCDGQDKIIDGVLTYPEMCKPTFKDIACRSKAPADGTCLTQAQMKVVEQLYSPTMLGGAKVYPGFLPGLEESGDVLDGSARKAIDWLLMALKGETNVTADEVEAAYNNLFTLDEIRQWQKENIGGGDVSGTNLAPFFSRGGKLIHYHGLADLRVSPLASRAYHGRVYADKANEGIDLDRSYRYFEVPGMKHCRDGSGPWQIGAVTQTDPGNRPYQYTAHYDAVLALVAWVESGIAPDYLIGTSYRARSAMLPTNLPDPNHNDLPIQVQSYDYGVAFTRKICPYPLRPVAAADTGITVNYNGPDAYLSFVCDTVQLLSPASKSIPTSYTILALHVSVLALALLVLH
ncbi:hypothetical protein ACQY0O_006708 [Thecaphora frezii]